MYQLFYACQLPVNCYQPCLCPFDARSNHRDVLSTVWHNTRN